MARTVDILPRVAIFVAGVAAGAFTGLRRERPGMDPAGLQDLKQSLAGLDKRLTQQESASAARFTQVEARLEEHAAKLAACSSQAIGVASSSA